MNPNAKEFVPRQAQNLHQNGTNTSKLIDVSVRFGMSDWIDLQGRTAHCFLCFETFSLDHVAHHIGTDYHKILLKATNKILDKKEPSVNTNNNIINDCKPSSSKDVTDNIFNREYRNLPKYEVIYANQKEEVRQNYMSGNFMEFRKETNQAYCTICDILILAKMSLLSEHVNGNNHRVKELLKAKNKAVKSSNYQTIRIDQFLSSLEEMQFDSTPCYIVNKTIFIEFSSWTLMMKIKSNTIRCLVCEITLENLAVMPHLNERKHKDFMESPVVNLEYEFVREIEPDKKFHCALCNKIEKSWFGLERHISSVPHRRAKTRSDEMVALLKPNGRDEMATLLSLLKMLG